MTDPQRLGDGALRSMERILRARGMNPRALPETGPAPDAADRLARVDERIPPRYRNAEADQPQVREWVRQVIAQARPANAGARPEITTGPSLLMAGVTGAGKTHQAYGAVRALTRAGIAVRWEATTAADLYAELRPQTGTDTERTLARVSRVPVLILDELGGAKTTEWVEEITTRLINRRYNLLLPTLITTNLAIRDLRTQLGDRVASRLAEMTTRVAFEPVDRRRQRPAA
ncbi:ATP-binding protein [Streptomyces acidiscabies]|uniref:ATP-binding protein n=1 Tax=Streptomyces acidiscabies TaxID=42234 RepID=A0AAP6BLL6_9ACTN|nr:ATP-binding protein [Streptomyces acidiscabies]MBP5936738.1 ATP-binding protein [Streptomyces sp. LBUM 1476]MBZ3915256.1 ATP-binding protein [Streptomyces acidiscabies]MDX2967017.1 ATP-binding protein [Streptomyces acidiscabies]MDX3021318.1 ATP-binding protein [Streptomyces acidiscabies]MDX3793429.1 ATP-binding protein [Streptomyces acidiscabies]